MQTPHSFVNAMEGAALRRQRDLDLGIITAWHTASFALGMYAGKLKGKTLSDFLLSGKPSEEDEGRMQRARVIHFFQSLKARGVPVEITRTVH
jgi:hypothetical protein